MNETRWAEVRRLFELVLDEDPDDPRAYLAEQGGADAGLIEEVLELLEGDARSETPLDVAPPRLDESPARALDDDDLPRVDLPPYRLIESVGRGGMGSVYRATRADGVIERAVALKLVHAGLDSSEILRRFQEERRILASLEHPNIARLYDAGRASDGRPFLVMEFVDGERIDEYADREALGVDDRLRLFLQVCEAVAHAHQGLVVHRDLKPSNILVTKDGTAKLLDFGIAKLIDPEGSDPRTRTGSRLMTPEYASLEQLRGEILSTRSDVYSLGVVLYELLTGHRPVQGWEEALARAAAGDHAPPLPRPSTRVTGSETGPSTVTGPVTGDRLARTLRGDLDEIVLKALRSDPRERYADVGALADDIRAYLARRPVSARPPSVGYRARKFVRRERGMVAAGVLLLLSLVGGTTVSAWQARRAAEQRDLAVAVSTFLEDLFRAPDPRAGVVADTTRMIDFLRLAESRVRDGLDDRPRARMELTLGTVYRNLSRTDLAIPVLRDAVQTHERVYGGDGHADAVEARRLLGMSLADTGDLEGGLIELEGALAAQVALEGADAPNTARLEEAIGRAYAAAQRNADAITWLERSLETRRRGGDETPVQARFTLLNTLGSVLAQDGRPADAVPYLTEAADLLAEPQTDLSPRVRRADGGYIRNNLSQVLMDLGRREEAEAQAARAWSLLDSAFAGANPAKATNLQRRATLLALRAGDDSGVISTADSLYRASISMKEGLPREPGAMMFGWNAYARSLRSWGRLPGREALLEDAATAFRTAVEEGIADFGPAHPLVMSGRIDLGSTLVELGRAAEGIAETTPAFEAVMAAAPPSHPMAGNAAIGHARALIAMGRPAEGHAVLQRVREPLAQALSPDHPLVETVDEVTAAALAAMGSGRD